MAESAQTHDQEARLLFKRNNYHVLQIVISIVQISFKSERPISGRAFKFTTPMRINDTELMHPNERNHEKYTYALPAAYIGIEHFCRVQ